MDPASVGAISAALTSTVKLTEKVFEIRAVDKQASSLLETINEVNGQLDVAQQLRRQKSAAFTALEKDMMDSTFQSTERAISNLAKLVEPCRVAMETGGGDVGLGTRLMFILRDSPNTQVSLTRLGLASQSLHTSLILLCSREASQAIMPQLKSSMPPTYEESQFLTESRARNMLRKASRTISSDESRDYSLSADHEHRVELAAEAEHCKGTVDEPTGLFDHEPDTEKEHIARYSGQYLPFIPYRPGTSSVSTDNSAPTTRRPGPLGPFQSGSRDLPSKHLSTASRSSNEKTCQTVWIPSPPLWDCASRRPSAKPPTGSNVIITRSMDAAEPSTALELPAFSNFAQGCTFAFPSASTNPVPTPLFSKMVKLDSDLKTTENIRRVIVSLRRKPATSAGDRTMPSVESEYPEAIVVSGLETARESECPEVFIPHDLPVLSAETTTLVTEVPAATLEAARQRRAIHARDIHGLGRPRTDSKPYTQRNEWMAKLPSYTATTRHPNDGNSERRWSEADGASSATKVNARLSAPSALTGRARSQRWREIQFEKFEKLHDPQLEKQV